MANEPHEMGELRRRVTADRRRGLRRGLLALIAAVVIGVTWSQHHERVRAYVRGEIELDGRPRFSPRHPVDRRALSAIDFERVNARLIPAWTIALGRVTSPLRRRWADRELEELNAEVELDPNLRWIFTSVHRAMMEDPIANARRLDYLLWAYNHYLDEQRVPWRLEAALVLGEDRPALRVMTYEVLADARTAHGERIRLLRRADRTNTLEGWLALTRDEEGAMIVMQRVLHFAVRHVWPALHPALDERRPAAERPWLGHVREEVRAALDQDSYALLSETAADQQALIEVAEAVEARHACGSRFSIRGLPYNGLSARDREALSSALMWAHEHEDCPEITLGEAALVVGASERLATTPHLEDAVERLAMVVARSVAVHELQHAMDGDDPVCFHCPPRVRGAARAEVSAYLSALSTEGAGYLALLQACGSPRGTGVRGAALGAVLEALLPYGCEGPTHDHVYEDAERIERHLFGKRAAVVLPRLPARVTLLPRAPRRRRVLPEFTALEGGWGVDLRTHEDQASAREQ